MRTSRRLDKLAAKLAIPQALRKPSKAYKKLHPCKIKTARATTTKGAKPFVINNK